MATETEKLKLVKPAGGDYVDVGVLNANMDKIDEFAEQIDGEYLPRTGGTLSGELLIDNGLGVSTFRTINDAKYRLQTYVGNLFNDGCGALMLFDVTGPNPSVSVSGLGINKDGVYFRPQGGSFVGLYGEHNLSSSLLKSHCNATIADYVGISMSTYDFITNQMHLNTSVQITHNYTHAVKLTDVPFNYGVVVMRKGATVNYRTAIGIDIGSGKVYSYCYSNTFTEGWKELGGGLMSPVKVTRHTASGSYSGTGKGKLFFNADYGYTTSISSVVIDGVSIGTLSNIEIGESFEIDFTKSYSFTLNNSNASNTNVTAVFY